MQKVGEQLCGYAADGGTMVGSAQDFASGQDTADGETVG